MHLLSKKEIEILRYLDKQGAQNFSRHEVSSLPDLAAKIGLNVAEFNRALVHLTAAFYVDERVSNSGGLTVIDISGPGRVIIREINEQPKRRLLWMLEKLVFSVVIPVLVAGATAYYVAFLTGKK